MKITCELNKKPITFSTYSNKPLSLLLMEESPVTSIMQGCQGGYCGNCIVLLNGKPVLSCLVPAFMIRDASILTFEGFSKSKYYRDISRGFADAGVTPCHYCAASKTLIIQALLNETTSPDPREILKALAINECHCIDEKDLVTAVTAAAKYRRRRRVRRS